MGLLGCLACSWMSRSMVFCGRKIVCTELAVLGGVTGDQVLLNRLIQTLAEHGVEAADGFVAQAEIFHPFIAFDSAFGLGPVVELLEIQRGELAGFDFADVWDDVFINIVFVVGGGGFPDGGLGVILEPSFRSLAYRELARFVGIDFSRPLQSCRQLFLTLFLRFREDIFVDSFSRFWVMACCVAALPAAILALANVALALGTLLRHLDQLLPGNGRPVPAHRNSCCRY